MLKMVTGNIHLLHIMNFENLYKRGLLFQQHTVSEEKLAENPGEPTLGLKPKILGWFIIVEVERQAAGSPTRWHLSHFQTKKMLQREIHRKIHR
jgi:hypothetical protein